MLGLSESKYERLDFEIDAHPALDIINKADNKACFLSFCLSDS